MMMHYKLHYFISYELVKHVTHLKLGIQEAQSLLQVFHLLFVENEKQFID